MTAATRQLYRDHGHAVMRRARRLLRNEDDARDVVQDVFLELFRNPERFEARSSIATYLYAAATTRASTGCATARIARGCSRSRPRRAAASAPARGETRALAREILAELSEDDAALAVYLVL